MQIYGYDDETKNKGSIVIMEASRIKINKSSSVLTNPPMRTRIFYDLIHKYISKGRNGCEIYKCHRRMDGGIEIRRIHL